MQSSVQRRLGPFVVGTLFVVTAAVSLPGSGAQAADSGDSGDGE